MRALKSKLVAWWNGQRYSPTSFTMMRRATVRPTYKFGWER